MNYFMLFLIFLCPAWAERTPVAGRPKNHKETDQSPSTETFLHKGNRLPTRVDLTKFFREEIPPQKGGLCHLYAGVALFEAACRRAIHTEVDLSEGYLTYRHLRSKIIPPYTSIHREYKETIFGSDLAGGHSKDTVDRILLKDVCAEKDLSMDKDFWPFLKALTEEKVSDDKLSTVVCERLDDKIRCSVKGVTKAYSTGFENLTSDPKILDCLAEISSAEQIDYPSVTKVLELLAKNIPVICNGWIKYENGQVGLHSYNLAGYELSSSGSAVKFINRDSNFSRYKRTNDTPLDLEIPVCESIVVIYTKKDQH